MKARSEPGKTPESPKKTAESRGRHPACGAPVFSLNGQMMQLHRTIGNRAALRFLQSGAFQAKLTVSRPDDIYEQEANRVADQVMRMPESAVGGTIQAKPG